MGMGLKYNGSEWTLTAQLLTSAEERKGGVGGEVLEVGKMFWEDTYGGISRLQAFHEHIGCTPCAAFYESEVRTGPWVARPLARGVANVSFTPPNATCQLFQVDIFESQLMTDSSVGPGGRSWAAQFKTGPGTR